MLLRCHQNVLIYLCFALTVVTLTNLAYCLGQQKDGENNPGQQYILNDRVSMWGRNFNNDVPSLEVNIHTFNHWLTTNLLTCQTPAELKHFKPRYNFTFQKKQMSEKPALRPSLVILGFLELSKFCIISVFRGEVSRAIFPSSQIYKCEVTKNRCLCLVCQISGDWG